MDFTAAFIAYQADLDLSPDVDEESDTYKHRIDLLAMRRGRLAAAARGLANGATDHSDRVTLQRLAIALERPAADSLDKDAISAWREAEPIVRALAVAPPPITYLDGNDSVILDYLSSIHPRIANTYEIEAGLDGTDTPITRKTIGERLKGMPQYVCQPKGERGGWGLTPAGLAILASL